MWPWGLRLDTSMPLETPSCADDTAAGQIPWQRASSRTSLSTQSTGTLPPLHMLPPHQICWLKTGTEGQVGEK